MEKTKGSELVSKRTAKQLGQCRDIVKEVLDFGVNEFMRLQIINLLALELENRDALVKICDVVKEYLPTDNQETDLIL